MRRLLMVLVLFGCGAGSDDDGDATAVASSDTLGETSTETSTDDGTSSTSTDDTGTTTDSTDTGTASTTDTTTTGTDSSSSETGPDCDAPADCETCWTCARNGACKTAYDTCEADIGCIPSLYCIEGNCTPDGLQQDCATNCCKSCQNTGACPYVDAALTCIEAECAGLCGDVSCG